MDSGSATTLLEQLYSAIVADRLDDALELLLQLRQKYDQQSFSIKRTVAQAQSARTQSARTTSDSSFPTIEDTTAYLSKTAQTRIARVVVMGQVAAYIETSGERVSKEQALTAIDQAKRQESVFTEETEAVQKQLDAATLSARVELLDVSVPETDIGVGETTLLTFELANVGDKQAKGVRVTLESGNQLDLSETTFSVGAMPPDEGRQLGGTASSDIEAQMAQSQKSLEVEITGVRPGADSVVVSAQSTDAGTARDSVTMTVKNKENKETPALAEYANANDVIKITGLRDAIGDWRDDEITTLLLSNVTEAWREGDPVN